MICARCGGSLLAREGILQAGRKYHRHCWTCAQCSLPLTSWVRKQPTGADYLCHTCHIQKNGLREGMIAVMWKKQIKSNPHSDMTSRTTFNDDILFI